jgi:CAAX prenyl protease-like protein
MSPATKSRPALRPALVRAAPLLSLLLLTGLQNAIGGAGKYWVYLLKIIVSGWLIWHFRREIAELQWKFTWEAATVGIGVFVLWAGLAPALSAIGINSSWIVMKPAGTAEWRPPMFFESAFLAWFFIVVRIIGSTVVVPPIEEVFFRSLVYRYVAKPDFQIVPVGQFLWMPFIITSILFGFEHREWLAGVLCGFAYQGLVCWKKRLGDAVTAHAITNFLLGLWVVHRNAWHFW